MFFLNRAYALVEDEITCRRREDVKVKGIHGKVLVYEIVPRRAPGEPPRLLYIEVKV